MGNPMYDLMGKRYRAFLEAAREREGFEVAPLADAPKEPPLEPETEQEKCQGMHWWQQYCPNCIPKTSKESA